MSDSIDDIKNRADKDFDREASSLIEPIINFAKSHPLATKSAVVASAAALIFSGFVEPIRDYPRIEWLAKSPITLFLKQAANNIINNGLNSHEAVQALGQTIVNGIGELVDQNGGAFMEILDDGSVSILAHNNPVLNSDRAFFSINIIPGERIEDLNQRIFENTGYHLEMIPYDSKLSQKIGRYKYPMNIREFSLGSLHTFPFAPIELFVEEDRIVGPVNPITLRLFYATNFRSETGKSINDNHDFRFEDFGGDS